MNDGEVKEERKTKRIEKVSLRTRLTLFVGFEMLVSIIIAFVVSHILNRFVPFFAFIPFIVKIVFFSLLIGIFATAFLSKYFFDPIRELREAMQKVADGDLGVKINTDSTSEEIKEVFAGFNMMTSALSATEILQTDFVSNVSHEIKTPISAIEGYTTLLQNCDTLDDMQREYTDKILFNTKRLSVLVGNVLLLSKLENQSIKPVKNTYSLDEQIRLSILALEPLWEEKEIEFDIEMEDIRFCGNENLMYHVWENLIGNAIKFNPHGGLVKIRLFVKDESIVFTVKDIGPGISENDKSRIFDKFYQGDSSHKSEGNGLGLALVKKILALNGGTVFVENVLSGGCKFTVLLNETKDQDH